MLKTNDVIKCEVFLLNIKFGRNYLEENIAFYVILLICSNLNLTAGFYEHFSI